MGEAPISKDAQIKKLARELVRGSIIEDAASRFVEMVLKEAHDSRIKPLHDRIEELEAKLVRLTEALAEIARQKKTDELETEYDVEVADFEGGYDGCIEAAYNTLAELKGGKDETRQN